MRPGRDAVAQQRTFASPEDAVKALIDIVKSRRSRRAAGALRAGRQGVDRVVRSRDRASEPRRSSRVAAREQWHLADDGPNRKTLVIGNEDWPFPVPLVKEAQRMALRHGGGEGRSAGAADRAQRAGGHRDLPRLCDARSGATRSRDTTASQPGVYATKFRSDPGKENGLYWPTGQGQKRSPLGDLVAQAAAEGRPVGGERRSPRRFMATTSRS